MLSCLFQTAFICGTNADFVSTMVTVVIYIHVKLLIIPSICQKPKRGAAGFAGAFLKRGEELASVSEVAPTGLSLIYCFS